MPRTVDETSDVVDELGVLKGIPLLVRPNIICIGRALVVGADSLLLRPWSLVSGGGEADRGGGEGEASFFPPSFVSGGGDGDSGGGEGNPSFSSSSFV